MTPMNNPMMQMIATMKKGGNPIAVLQSMASYHPQAAQMMKMMQGKNSQQLRQMAMNIAAERGTTVEDVARQLGITIPSDR